LDEEYLRLHDTDDEGRGNRGEWRPAFAKARAAAALCFAARGSDAAEAIFESTSTR
jgi:hypothetical protein